MKTKLTFFLLLVTTLYSNALQANQAFRVICRSNDHSLSGLLSNLTVHPLACARQCQSMAFCNYWAFRGNECLLGFGNTPCERNATDGALWVTYVKAGPLQTCNCGPEMGFFRNRCYIFPNGTFTWTQAYGHCAGLGAGMVELGDLYEHDFLVAQARERGYVNVHLGGSDSANEGTFTWNSGAPFTFTKWNPGEPNNSGGNEDCVALNIDLSAWNDVPESNWKSAVCERSCF